MKRDALEVNELKHSLATPLTSILCQLEMLLGDEKNSEVNLLKVDELKNILASAYQLRDLVGGRDLSLTVREVFNVEKELQKIACAFDKPYRPEVKLLTTGEQVEVFGHKRVFMEIIHILLCNAVEAYPHIDTDRPVKIVVMTLYAHTLIFICDRGCGMNWWQRLGFGLRGFSTKNIKSGLGLAKAKSDLAKHFSGELRLWHSDAGRGSAVVVILPVHSTDSASGSKSDE